MKTNVASLDPIFIGTGTANPNLILTFNRVIKIRSGGKKGLIKVAKLGVNRTLCNTCRPDL